MKFFLKRSKYALWFLPDVVFIQLYFFLKFGRFCNINKPQTYNEKIQWLKLHYRDGSYSQLVDKFEAKNFVREMIGEKHIIPTLGIYEKFDEIDFSVLPRQFVIKATHDSEGIVIVKDKEAMDITMVRNKIETAMKYNFYYVGREWPYKNVKPRIIVEKYMEDENDGELKDYKFFCFSGVPKILLVASGRSAGQTKFDFYDMEFNHLSIIRRYPNSNMPIRRPVGFAKMKEFAAILSRGFPHVRVDFYEVNDIIYFGELTFYPASGFAPFKPAKWDYMLGSYLELPERNS